MQLPEMDLMYHDCRSPSAARRLSSTSPDDSTFSSDSLDDYARYSATRRASWPSSFRRGSGGFRLAVFCASTSSGRGRWGTADYDFEWLLRYAMPREVLVAGGWQEGDLTMRPVSAASLRNSRNNLRIVRKAKTALRTLFPTVRGEILAATLTQPDKWWYLSELAQFLRTTPSSLQRHLKALVDGGILEQRREGTRAYVKADTRSPLFADLYGLVEKTAGLLPTLQRLLDQFDTRVDVAFVYGSIARGEEHATSDVDLLVIGTVGLAELAPALRKVEEHLGREVNVTSYARAEFRTKFAAGNHFLTEVLRGSKRFVKGGQRDLDEVVGKPRRSKASNIQKGTR